MAKNPKALMMLVLSVSLVTGAMLMGGCVGRGTGTPSPQETQIVDILTPEEAFALMQEKPDYVIIDTRTPEEFASKHIEGAINIDYRPGFFRDELNKLDKNKTYFFYYKPHGCCGDSLTSAVDIFQSFKELNFREAYSILGGLNSWRAKGLPIIQETPT